MTASVFLSRIIGLVRDMVLAHMSGTSTDMDAYVAAFLIPELLNHLIAGGFLSITFIPLFQKHLANNDTPRAWRTFSNLINVGTVVMGACIAICIFFTREVISVLASFSPASSPGHAAIGTSAEFINHTSRLTRIVLPAQIFFYWGSFLMAAQYAHKKFFIPALMPLCYNIGIIAGGIFLYKYCGIDGFAYGVLIGACIGGFLIQLPAVIKLGMHYTFVFDLKDKDLHRYVLLSLPFIAGLSMTFSNEFFFRVFGLFLEPGAVSSLNFALRIMMILVGVFGLAFASASYPFVSELASNKKFKEMNALTDAVICRTAVVLLPLSAFMIACAPHIVSVLFLRGKFSSASVDSTAPALAMYCIGAFGFSASAIVVRNWYALQNTIFPMIISTITVACSLPLYWLLGRSIGVSGIGLAGSLVMCAQFITIYYIWCSKHDNISGMKHVFMLVTKVTLISIVSGAAAYALARFCETTMIHIPNKTLKNILTLCIAALPAGAIAYGLMKLWSITYFDQAIALLLNRRARKASAAVSAP